MESHGDEITDEDVISSALYPNVFEKFLQFRLQYGPVELLDTKTFLTGPEIAKEVQVCVRRKSEWFCMLEWVGFLTKCNAT